MYEHISLVFWYKSLNIKILIHYRLGCGERQEFLLTSQHPNPPSTTILKRSEPLYLTKEQWSRVEWKGLQQED